MLVRSRPYHRPTNDGKFLLGRERLAFLGQIAQFHERTGYRFPRRGWSWSDSLLVLRTSSKSQSADQHGHDHDHFQKFQSISPPFVAGCSVRLGGESSRSNAFLYFFEPSQIGRPGFFRVAGGACACGHYFLLLLRTSSQSQGSETVDQSVSAFAPRKERAVLCALNHL